ncbi:phosphatase PAP2 family protein [Jeotgalibacillus soli]|uniref:Phosphatidic acid phosphatase type 2/haloperoxidase domain-containing protein n=1 Tax=Jeotgalibacillus soli TaxID=889306 RepID=A0A0C2VLJ8_9BACL|nr:phosphatase PAP2 family protein [Jeotgalibacillus soli]KIL45341.1 hypothetical protein KP78_28850 [Jeotgalibacillus soli]
MKWNRFQVRKALYYAIPLSIIFLDVWVFIELSEELNENALHAFDDSFIQLIQGQISEPLTILMIWITTLANSSILIFFGIVLVTVLLYKKQAALAVFIAVTNLLGGGFNWLLKSVFSRERPNLEVLIEQGGYSFPSGHAMGSIIFYGSLSVVIIMMTNRKSISYLTGVLSSLLILLIGISRIYLGVHFPSDIVAGFAAGAAWLTICISGYLLYRTKSVKN